MMKVKPGYAARKMTEYSGFFFEVSEYFTNFTFVVLASIQWGTLGVLVAWVTLWVLRVAILLEAALNLRISLVARGTWTTFKTTLHKKVKDLNTPRYFKVAFIEK
jgi:hypothetical protein